MYELFGKEVKVNQIEFKKLMKLLESKTGFTWDDEKPTKYSPEEFDDDGYVYIHFWNDFVMTHDSLPDRMCKLLNFKDLKNILTSN